ncbi:hypothetical protein B0H16DRAFT_1749480 [Mycena metata]|uniref:Uncharacterized protein n=1 Tax=Mycena metata TaxID=1033252 RepID=A0AAD7GKM0_9AGAR|nr:hypothetical protein B0H16DRAFT_1749480 [Mycena metata]
MSQVLSWAHQHGLRPTLADASALRSYAASECNRPEGHTTPDGERFIGLLPQDVTNHPSAAEFAAATAPAPVIVTTTPVIAPAPGPATEGPEPVEDGEILDTGAANAVGAPIVSGGAAPGGGPTTSTDDALANAASVPLPPDNPDDCEIGYEVGADDKSKNGHP